MKLPAAARHLLPLTIVVAGILLAGCVVMSVYPFYTAKDLVFDAALVGDWSDAKDSSSKEVWQFTKRDAKGYWLTMVETSKTNRYDARLFRLKQQLFLDLRTEREENNDACLPLHYVLKVQQIEPTFQAAIMNLKWLEKLLEKNPAAIRHMRYEETPGDTHSDIILTADTRELQTFLLKYVNDTNAFPDLVELKRAKK